jgi:hypothetical protein
LGELFQSTGLIKKNTVTDVVADVQKLDLKVNGYLSHSHLEKEEN